MSTERSEGRHQNGQEKNGEATSAATDSNKTGGLGCPVCGDTFNSTTEIDEHLKTHEV